MREAPHRLLAHSLALALLASDAALAAESAAPPSTQQDPCPAIAEGFLLCSSDPWSGNCAQFVAAAGQLAQLYQLQVADTPERVPMLLSTNWWGCGDAALTDMKALLLRIGTPAARAVLQQEPFARLAPPATAGAPTTSAPTVVPDCENAPTPDAQDACAARELASARDLYRRTLEACKARVAAPLRSALDGSEQAWEQELPGQCDAAAFEYQEPRLQTFARSQCLAGAMRERTRGMLVAHPECRPGP